MVGGRYSRVQVEPPIQCNKLGCGNDFWREGGLDDAAGLERVSGMYLKLAS